MEAIAAEGKKKKFRRHKCLYPSSSSPPKP
jgi:hypothetical protein